MTGKKKLWLMLLILSNGIIFGQPKKSYPFVIQFQNRVGNKLLNLDSTYINIHGETFTVRNFRYYLNRFSVTGSNGKTYALPQRYFLIDERKLDSKRITLQIPLPAIKAIAFEIGVDSSKNVSGVQTGALDPANGMFWTWNSGYIFAKLEGTSPQAKTPQNSFTYHIGGFRKGENANRSVYLISSPVKDSLVIGADINTWFNGAHPFRIADLPSIMTPGLQAMQMADNYSKMFSIVVPE